MSRPSARRTWFISVSEIVLAVPLTVVVAAVLWQPRTRGAETSRSPRGSVVLLVAEVRDGRHERRAARAGRYGVRPARDRSTATDCHAVAALWLLSVSSRPSVRAGNPTHSQSFLYFVVSLEPWPFYLALVGIARVSSDSGRGSSGRAACAWRSGASLVVAAAGLQSVAPSGSRSGAAVARLLLSCSSVAWIDGDDRSRVPRARSGRPARGIPSPS